MGQTRAVIVGAGSWSLPDQAGSGPAVGPPTDSIMQSPSTTAPPWLIVAVPW